MPPSPVLAVTDWCAIEGTFRAGWTAGEIADSIAELAMRHGARTVVADQFEA